MKNITEHNARRERARCEKNTTRRASRQMLADLARADAQLHMALDTRTDRAYV